MLASLLAACLVLVVGGFLAQRVPLLGRYSIPAPTIGGLLFAVLALVVNRISGLALAFDTSAKVDAPAYRAAAASKGHMRATKFRRTPWQPSAGRPSAGMAKSIRRRPALAQLVPVIESLFDLALQNDHM